VYSILDPQAGQIRSAYTGVRVLGIERERLHVTGLEAIDGTPIVDLKPVLGSVENR
jgi:tRNA (Thr-GGU) A37 N-methylase